MAIIGMDDEITMDSSISVAQVEPRMQPRAMSIADFCARYGVGRTKVYEEINAKRLRARKAGKRTLIADDDAEAWLRHLPTIRRETVSA